MLRYGYRFLFFIIRIIITTNSLDATILSVTSSVVTGFGEHHLTGSKKCSCIGRCIGIISGTLLRLINSGKIIRRESAAPVLKVMIGAHFTLSKAPLLVSSVPDWTRK